MTKTCLTKVEHAPLHELPCNETIFSACKDLIPRRRNSSREILPAKYGWSHMGDSIEFSHSFRSTSSPGLFAELGEVSRLPQFRK